MGEIHNNMINKLKRTNAMLIILEAGGIFTVDYLSERLFVTRRSIVNYVKILKDAGFPIYSFTASGGGLYLDIDKYKQMDIDGLKKKISVKSE